MNNKKIKSFASFSIILLALAIIGQFYTNYKIDQILSQFPYHLDNKFKISVIEKNSDFFTRDLTFSLEQNDQITDFIHTKLTALPAMISAESQLNPILVKKLNQQLNITIDQNTIINQFIVFNENLTSRMLTSFRDGTNKPHSLESELSYSTKNGNIEIKTILSGFNYDNFIEIKDLIGHFRLEQINETLYDINSAKLKTKNIDINLLDGENTHIGIVKGEYEINKNLINEGHNLEHNFRLDNIYLSNKLTHSEQDRIQSKNFSLSAKQIGIPTSIDLINPLKQIDHLDLNKLMQYLANILFNNQNFYSKINFDSFTLPNSQYKIELGKTQLILDFNNQNKQNSEHLYKLNIDSFYLLDKNQDSSTIKLNGVAIQNQIFKLNLAKNLDFLIRYIPQNTNKIIKKNQIKDFIRDLKDFSNNYTTELFSEVKLGKLSVENKFDSIELDNFTFNYQQKPINHKLEIRSNFELDKFSLLKQQMQFHQIKFDLPAKLFIKDKSYQDYICAFPLYSLICNSYLEKNNTTELSKRIIDNIAGEINNASLTGYMGSNSNEKSSIMLNLNINTGNSLINSLQDKLSDFQLKGEMSAELIELNKPNTYFWQVFFGSLIDLSLSKDQQDNKYKFNFNHQPE